jgi:predicted O-methyltransferase YrrM
MYISKFSVKQNIKLVKMGLFPFKVFSHMTSNELFKLNYLSKNLPTSSVLVEIGSFLGASTVFIAEGISDTSKLYCIDTWQNDAMSEGRKDTYRQFQNNVKKFKHKIHSIREWSYEAALSFDLGIDFIFFDGDHSYEGVKKDFDLWSPKMKNGSVMVFHDSGWAEGVQRVIKEDVIPMAKKTDSLPNMFWAFIER